ncbi:MAG: sigma-70 family RNA polymerase sigma factor [Phycisphaerae bacterium]|nr:sigma-70 family RNA polymerase sigma factor [Phycisphaerae bacterium]
MGVVVAHEPEKKPSDDGAPGANVTVLLGAAAGGDARAASELLPLVYEELRRLASNRLAGERAGQTLQPTALVHEAYLKLLGPDGRALTWGSRGQFFAAAAVAMRRILVDRARHRQRMRHGGGRAKVELHDDHLSDEPDPEQMLALDEALEKLRGYDPRKSELVMLRYFGGLSIEDAADAMSLSPATIKTEWAYCRAWLHRELAGGSGAS